jgi:superfamily I DNA/RNA helicase
VSFTNAATEDLRDGIRKRCATVPGIEKARITTLHSLALTILSLGKKLSYYPVRPRVLDEWEQRFVFDEELARSIGCALTRARELRAYFESQWSTGQPPAPHISSPKVPIAPDELAAFTALYRRATQTYAFILPGEPVRLCVDEIKAGTLDPVALTGLKHLIVDEYQDLNRADIELIDLLAAKGVVVFALGDDDQSIYSFRHAYPEGIQDFLQRHNSAGSHVLQHCFRCSEKILAAATSVLASFPPPKRIPKVQESVYKASTPPVPGQALGWAFQNVTAEAKAVAASVKALLTQGTAPEDILILISSRDAQAGPLLTALVEAGVKAEVQSSSGYAGEDGTRFVYAILRTMSDSEDYVALRTLLGIRAGVGMKVCSDITDACHIHHLNFADQFTPTRTTSAFSTRQLKALDGVVAVRASVVGWTLADTLGARKAELDALVSAHLPASALKEWRSFTDALPDAFTLEEVRDVLGARGPKHVREVLRDAFARIGSELPPEYDPAGRVRIMTLHSSKGLSAKAVFLPGLEDEILPGPYRAKYSGQVSEAARLLYVGITRARALCVLSYSKKRPVNGSTKGHEPSRFVPSLGVPFAASSGLGPAELQAYSAHVADL